MILSSSILYRHLVFHLLYISSLLFLPPVLRWARSQLHHGSHWLSASFLALCPWPCLHLSSVTPFLSSSYAKVSGRVYLIMNRWVPACFLWPPPSQSAFYFLPTHPPLHLTLSTHFCFWWFSWSSRILLLQFRCYLSHDLNHFPSHRLCVFWIYLLSPNWQHVANSIYQFFPLSILLFPGLLHCLCTFFFPLKGSTTPNC